MTQYNPVVSYRWDVPADYTITEVAPTKGKPYVRIKGRACKAGEVSKNGRVYVRKALIRSENTWFGKPANVNHAPLSEEDAREQTKRTGIPIKFDPNLIIGNVNEMPYNEEKDQLEYNVDVKKEPYVTLVREKSKRITGVSIQADYLRNKCPDCGQEDFLTTEAFEDHMGKQHGKRNIKAAPWGIMGRALSLVVDVPTGCDTTLELAETRGFGDFNSLCETVNKDLEKQEKILLAAKESGKIAPVAVQEKTSDLAFGHSVQPKTEAPEIFDPIHKGEASRDKFFMGPAPTPPATTVVTASIKEQEDIHGEPSAETRELKIKLDPVIIAETVPKLQLGEPFGGYSDFADCVAKNQDKENPEAYCGQIKHETEGETFRWKHVEHLTDTVNEIIKTLSTVESAILSIHDDSWREPLQKFQENFTRLTDGMKMLIEAVPKDDVSWKEAISNLPKDDLSWQPLLKEIKESIVKDDLTWKELKIPDVKPLQEKLDALEKRSNDEFAAYKKDLLEFWKPKADKVDALEKENAELKQKLENQVKETAEVRTIAENAEDKASNNPKFKGQSKPLDKKEKW